MLDLRGVIGGANIRLSRASYASRAGSQRNYEPQRITGFQEFHKRLSAFATEVSNLRELMGQIRDSSKRGKAAGVTSSDAVVSYTSVSETTEISPATSTTLTSAAAIDGSLETFTDKNPDWTGFSTAKITVRGVYQGDINDTMNFQVIVDADSEVNKAIAVTDSNGDAVDYFLMQSGVNVFNLSNGLEVQINTGTKKDGDTFSFDVYPETETDLNVSFQDSNGRNSVYGSDGQFRVKTGNFTINGVTIDVHRTNSIQNVLDQINASAAGVTASYDAATDKLTLANNDPGATEILLGSDTSGFLDAMRLSDGVETLGADAVEQTNTYKVTSDNVSLSAGTFFINGETFSVNDGDAISDIVDRINDAEVGVQARLTGSGRLSISSLSRKGTLTLADGSSGLFDDLGVDTGTFKGSAGRGATSQEIHEVVDHLRALRGLAEELSEEVDGESFLSGELEGFRKELGKLARGDVDGIRHQGTRQDVEAIFGDDASDLEDFFDVTGASRSSLQSILSSDPRDVATFLAGDDDGDEIGLLGNMLEDMVSISDRMSSQYSSLGLVLNIKI
jgi:hypothetical protein